LSKAKKETGSDCINLLLAAINAKYIHSSLAMRSIKANCPHAAVLSEFTINQREDYILAEIYSHKPDCVAFSCYIWNIEIVKRLINQIKKIMPKTTVILGGPEASYNPVYFPDCDIIIRGEGENVFAETLRRLSKGGAAALRGVRGVSYIYDGKVFHNENAPLPDLNALKFPYGVLDVLNGKIVYYESSRGCPFACAYCLESVTDRQGSSLRFLELPRVYKELGIFLENRTPQVKFIDRTFNCVRERAEKIWDFLINADNGVTNFHFEIAADLLDERLLALLRRARKGLFQFEAGVQSTNARSLEAVKRKANLAALLENAWKIKSFGNIHTHLDLIAGLPFEDYASFRRSFNDTYSAQPDVIQLGFLKLLHGSELRNNAEKYGLIFRETAPYEVLETANLSCGEIFRLKNIEKMTDFYYNTGNYKMSVKYLSALFETPFDFFAELAIYWERKGFFDISHNRLKMYENLYGFAAEHLPCGETAADILLYDMLAAANTGELPEFCRRTVPREIKKGFYHDKAVLSEYVPNCAEYPLNYIIKNTCLMFFSYDVISWTDGSELIKRAHYILFNYMGKEIATAEVRGLCPALCV